MSAEILGYPRELYSSAVLHVVVAKSVADWILPFGFVELLPQELPPPLYDGVITGPQLRRSGWRMYANHVPMSVDDAIDWYEDARNGNVVVPRDGGRCPRANEAGAVVCAMQLRRDEPAWSAWICASERTGLPFLSNWHKTPRIHHLIPLEFPWPLEPGEVAQADDFFEREVGLRLADWPVFAGSVHLVAPNPYYRCLHERASAIEVAPGGGKPRIGLSVEPRRGVAVPDLRIEVIDEHPTGIATSGSVTLGSGSAYVSIQAPIRAASARVWLASSGSLLEAGPPGRFLNGINVALDIGGEERKINVIDGSGQILESYTVEIMFPMTPAKLAKEVSPADQLAAMFREQDVRRSARTLEQHWFSGDQAGAHAFVRTLLKRAREQVWIADPYLGGVEVARFALAVPFAKVKIRILTTAKAFKANTGSPPPVSPEQLEAWILKWTSSDPTLGSIDIKVMPHDDLHDRFLRIDDRLYVLGNSLNGLGGLGSLVMRVPDPSPMFRVLEEIFESDSTSTLAQYIARRSSNAPQG